MNKYLRGALVVALPVFAAAGCSDFLKCTECVQSPNNPLAATLRQRFEAIQANNWQYQEGDLARLISMWMQQMSGTDRQYKSLGTYVISESDEDGEFSRPYQSGGLIDLRALEAGADSAGDQVFLGVAQVLEAWMIGTTADMWGDIPYSEAASPDSFPTPKLDAQQDVYNSVQSLLDQAITNLAGSGSGPGDADLVYGGDPTMWTQLAYTLKARFYLHTAEQLGTPAYQAALDAATKGISSNDADYVSLHTTKDGETNPWYQFMVVQRSGYISAGKNLLDMLGSSDDPRLDEYYSPGDSIIITPTDTTPDTTHVMIGAAPGQQAESYIATLDSARLAKDYGQAEVTFNENLLIQAEALYQLGREPEALAALNAERDAWGTVTSWHSALTLDSVSASGPALLQAIMKEKYITLFQNIETWNDYKRTCIPALTPAKPSGIPGRLYYGTTERQTNPNIPDVASQPQRNWNDPNPCPSAP